MIHARSSLSMIALLAALTAPRAVLADDVDKTSAAELFKVASTAYARGENRAAAIGFEEAYRRAPRGAAIFNAALAWDSADEPARAADAFAIAAGRSDLAAEQVARATARLEVLERALGRLDVTAPAGAAITVAHVTKVASPAHVHARAGQYEVSVTFASGATEKRSLTAAAGHATPATFSEPAAPPPLRAVVPPPLSAARPERPSRTASTLGWIGLGGAAAATTAAIVLGAEGLSARDDFNASQQADAHARDRAILLRTSANIAWISAAVLGSLGVVLLVTSPSGSSRAVAVSPGGIAGMF